MSKQTFIDQLSQSNIIVRNNFNRKKDNPNDLITTRYKLYTKNRYE